MKQSDAWFIQAEADYRAAQLLLIRDDPAMYCQVIAKCQQSVEKYIKGLVVKLEELGAIQNSTKGRGHTLEKEFKVLTIRMQVSSKKKNDLSSGLRNVLQSVYVDGANVLCTLAPKLPESGRPYGKNTEYPFNLPDNSWTAPSTPKSFALNEVDRFISVAKHFDRSIPRFIKSASL